MVVRSSGTGMVLWQRQVVRRQRGVDVEGAGGSLCAHARRRRSLLEKAWRGFESQPAEYGADGIVAKYRRCLRQPECCGEDCLLRGY